MPDCLLLMQVGAFMHVMDDDARAVSELTGLKLVMAGDVDAPVVLGGFPKSGLDKWVGKLARAGYSTAIAFQSPEKERHVAEVIRVTPRASRGETRDGSRRILQRILEANDSRDRGPVLEALRREIESFKVTARLAQESEAFAYTVVREITRTA